MNDENEGVFYGIREPHGRNPKDVRFSVVYTPDIEILDQKPPEPQKDKFTLFNFRFRGESHQVRGIVNGVWTDIEGPRNHYNDSLRGGKVDDDFSGPEYTGMTIHLSAFLNDPLQREYLEEIPRSQERRKGGQRYPGIRKDTHDDWCRKLAQRLAQEEDFAAIQAVLAANPNLKELSLPDIRRLLEHYDLTPAGPEAPSE